MLQIRLGGAALALAGLFGCAQGDEPVSTPQTVFGRDQRVILEPSDPLTRAFGIIASDPARPETYCTASIVGPNVVLTTATCAGIRSNAVQTATAFYPDAARTGDLSGRAIKIVDVLVTGATDAAAPVPQLDYAIVILESDLGPEAVKLSLTESPRDTLTNAVGFRRDPANGKLALALTARCKVGLWYDNGLGSTDCDAEPLAIGGALVATSGDARSSYVQALIVGDRAATGGAAQIDQWTVGDGNLVANVYQKLYQRLRDFLAGDVTRPPVDPNDAANAAIFARLCADDTQPAAVRATIQALKRHFRETDCGKIGLSLQAIKDLDLGYYFDRDRYGIESLEPFALLPKVVSINIGCYHPVRDLTPLLRMKGLASLNIYAGCNGSDVPVRPFDLAQIAGIKLKKIYVSADKAAEMLNVQTIGTMTELESVGLDAGLSATTFPKPDFITSLTKLKHLFIDGWYDLSFDFWMPRTLETVELDCSPKIKDLRGFRPLDKLRSFKNSCAEGVSDLTPFAGLVNLEELIFEPNRSTPASDDQRIPIRDLTPLRNLKKLKHIELPATLITSLDGLEDKPDLKKLVLYNSNVRDVLGIYNAVSLEYLDLNGTKVTAVEPLQDLKNLLTLYMTGTGVANVTPLGKITSLKDLDLSKNKIQDLTPLKTLIGVSRLNLKGQTPALVNPVCPVQDPFGSVCLF